jgi:Trehalase-like, N-terminal
MSYQPIENYGIIGNIRTVAHVGMNGSIDWYCYPHFDSPSVFGAILDANKGGRFQISSDADGVRHNQFYWPSTNVLVTRFLLTDGIAELEDFMPWKTLRNSLVFMAAWMAGSHWSYALINLQRTRLMGEFLTPTGAKPPKCSLLTGAYRTISGTRSDRKAHRVECCCET